MILANFLFVGKPIEKKTNGKKTAKLLANDMLSLFRYTVTHMCWNLINGSYG
jgi:hypothetical protein